MNTRRQEEIFDKIDNIHTNVEVMRTKIANIEEAFKTQNGKVNSNCKDITDLKVDTADLKSKIWVFLFIGSIIGGVFGSILSKFV